MPRHDLDVVSLVAGVVFGGTAVVFLVDRATGVSGRWVWPILLILVGVVGLVVTGTGGRRPDAARPGDAADAGTGDGGTGEADAGADRGP